MKRNLKKSILATVVAAPIVIGLAACGSSTTANETPPSPSVSASQTPSTAASKDSKNTQEVMTLDTNKGKVVIDLDKKAPKTIEHIQKIIDSGYWTAHDCHRLTTEGLYVLQCGDPSGSGAGGSGLEPIAEENLPKEAMYKRGTVAMAKTAAPNTTDSQFFLVYQDSPLPPDYTVLGTIAEGQNIIDQVAKAGTVDGSGDGPAKDPLTINKITIS